MYTKSLSFGKRSGTPPMVSRTPPVGDVATDTHQGNTAHLPSNTVVKETQRELSSLESPQQIKPEGQMRNKAQDVAELKDYVCIAVLRTKVLISNMMPATR